MSTTLYGLPKCSTCAKAQGWLRKFDLPFEFIDYRERRIAPELLKDWAAQLGGWDWLLNRASTTWRELPAARKQPASAPEFLLLLKEYPTLLKRPALVHQGRLTLGFTDKLYKSVFGL
jgi:Spx/MgsR family transcriptional regulator